MGCNLIKRKSLQEKTEKPERRIGKVGKLSLEGIHNNTLDREQYTLQSQDKRMDEDSKNGERQGDTERGSRYGVRMNSPSFSDSQVFQKRLSSIKFDDSKTEEFPLKTMGRYGPRATAEFSSSQLNTPELGPSPNLLIDSKDNNKRISLSQNPTNFQHIEGLNRSKSLKEKEFQPPNRSGSLSSNKSKQFPPIIQDSDKNIKSKTQNILKNLHKEELTKFEGTTSEKLPLISPSVQDLKLLPEETNGATKRPEPKNEESTSSAVFSKKNTLASPKLMLMEGLETINEKNGDGDTPKPSMLYKDYKENNNILTRYAQKKDSVITLGYNPDVNEVAGMKKDIKPMHIPTRSQGSDSLNMLLLQNSTMSVLNVENHPFKTNLIDLVKNNNLKPRHVKMTSAPNASEILKQARVINRSGSGYEAIDSGLKKNDSTRLEKRHSLISENQLKKHSSISRASSNSQVFSPINKNKSSFMKQKTNPMDSRSSDGGLIRLLPYSEMNRNSKERLYKRLQHNRPFSMVAKIDLIQMVKDGLSPNGEIYNFNLNTELESDELFQDMISPINHRGCEHSVDITCMEGFSPFNASPFNYNFPYQTNSPIHTSTPIHNSTPVNNSQVSNQPASIYNIEDYNSKIDLDKFSLVTEQINVEYDEKLQKTSSAHIDSSKILNKSVIDSPIRSTNQLKVPDKKMSIPGITPPSLNKIKDPEGSTGSTHNSPKNNFRSPLKKYSIGNSSTLLVPGMPPIPNLGSSLKSNLIQNQNLASTPKSKPLLSASLSNTDKQSNKLRLRANTVLVDELNEEQSQVLDRSKRGDTRNYKKLASTSFVENSEVVHTSKLDITHTKEGKKKINQYEMLKDLGRGGFGKVKLALSESDNKYYAIKIANKKKLKKKMLGKTTNMYTNLEKEVAIMKKLNHPNVVRLFEVIDDPEGEKLYLVMEYMKKGAILSKSFWKYQVDADFIKGDEETEEKRPLTKDQTVKYFREFLLGLDYLHNYANVIHRDIKPENLLIDENDCLKISDFGVSQMMENGDDGIINNAGTKAYLAPETYEGKSFKGKPTDIWAAGAMLFFLLTAKLPFKASNAEELKRKVLFEQPEFPNDMPSDIVDLIGKCLEKNPERRITLNRLMNHSWVTSNGKIYLENIYDDDFFDVTESDIKAALSRISFTTSIFIAIKSKKTLSKARQNLFLKKSSSNIEADNGFNDIMTESQMKTSIDMRSSTNSFPPQETQK